MRSIYCGELNESCLDREVTLCGWVHRRRDHGGVIFVDLRDHTGLLQVVFDPDTVQPRMPEVVHDLPAGAKRLKQTAQGISHTVVAGEVLLENNEHTGATPGRLLRV